MEFRIADTFTQSLARLTGDEQKAVKTTAFDLQIDPSSPGMSFHKLDKARDKNFWSVRVSGDLRLIVHKQDGNFLLCYVDHHDKAYEWAERRKLEIHPKTGAAQFVEIRETVKEVFTRVYVEGQLSATKRYPPLFASFADDVLLGYGVPQEWLQDVQAATEETLFSLIDHLPAEAGEALLELATGNRPAVAARATQPADAFNHPDAQRRFRTMNNLEELERAFEYPWDKWAVFLHPSQRFIVERNFSGPARVSGSAGTGKTIVALHRAVFLAKTDPSARVLLTTFSPILANALRVKLRRLVSNEPRLAERIDIYAIDQVGLRLFKSLVKTPQLVTDKKIAELVEAAAKNVEGIKFGTPYLVAEWTQVVDAWQLHTWESYRDVKRLGRKTKLSDGQRANLWTIFENVNRELADAGLLTISGMFKLLVEALKKQKKSPYDFAVIDEAQDLGVCHLKFLAAVSGQNPNAMFFAGDLGQRIFRQAFSWKSLGVDIRGRGKTLTVNYRTSHQIRQHADRLLAPVIADVDGNREDRSSTVSVFNGPDPIIKSFKTQAEESGCVGDWILELLKTGNGISEIGIFVRSENEMERAKQAARAAAVPFVVLDENVETVSGKISLCTMHLAKGLEFKSVVVMACDDEVIPSQQRISGITDNADLEEVYNTERQLLYVACTRAREALLITATMPESEFLEDLRMNI